MYLFQSISEFHHQLSLLDPKHPLVSVIHLEDIQIKEDASLHQFATDFYSISLKKDIHARMKYGQQYYDFDEGIMSFTAPKQVQSHDRETDQNFQDEVASGYGLLIHPDFLARHPLAIKIKRYGFFSYATREALHLSSQEEKDTVEIFRKIDREIQHIDRHTQDIILSQMDLLLHYCHRFYERQFLTRRAVNHDLLTRMEKILENYFDTEELLTKGQPTVEHVADQLHVTPHYLSDMLRSLTGQSAQHHIHEKMIAKAKEYLTLTDLSVAEIAFRLGFGYPQSFNKLFRKKMESSPLEYRKSFSSSD